MKKSKNKKKNVKEPIVKKSKTILKRKQARKDKRQARKAAQKEYVTKKFRKVQLADHEDEEIPSDGEDLVGGGAGKEKQAPKKSGQNDHEKIKKQIKELTRQQKRQRKKQLMLANEAEQQNIKQLEKNLGLKRRKSKNMPKSFAEDGLDFLLDACDSSKLANWNDDMEEEDDSEVDQKPDQNIHSDDDDDSVLDGLFSDNNEEDEKDSSQDQSDGGDTDGEEDDASLQDEDEDLSNTEYHEEEEDFKEDIYGRKRDVRGNIVKSSEHDSGSQTVGKYVPPAMRNKANLGVSEEKKKALERLSKQLKGLLNRLAESNMIGISREIEKFYNSNSRNDVNRSLADLLESSLVHETALIPTRLIMEHCMLVAILTGNVGTEVGAFMLQHMVGKFNDQLIKLNERDEESRERDVSIDNLIGK